MSAWWADTGTSVLTTRVSRALDKDRWAQDPGLRTAHAVEESRSGATKQTWWGTVLTCWMGY